MKRIQFLTIILVGFAALCVACKKADGVDEYIKKMKAEAAAKTVIAQDEVDKYFAPIFKAKQELDEAEKRVSLLKEGTNEYSLARRQVDSKREALLYLVENMNDKYYSIIGFHLSEVSSMDEYKVASDLVKSRLAGIILEKYKKLTLDYVNSKYGAKSEE